ncbi:MAG: glutamyl-tRNA reductase [Rhodospirillales bacterium CG15_BIG_FIL_POST_REV_8_21_14_020_66_15]|nr:MAG: glutamyl-tRNA reductase [Rhodospirillales bacterium CG15_BIG_FIL_POST_REV_8_21_14_020_66_15]
MAEDRAQSARPFVAGVNHRTSSLGLRDQMFIEDEAVPGVLARLRAAGVDEAVLLSTCDRVEVVGAHTDPQAAADTVLGILAEETQVPLADLKAQANVAMDEAAVLHLFNIAASLASLVIGEPQVLGQVKAAHRMAKERGLPSGVLDALLQAAYGAAKRVRTETGVGVGPVSIAAVATMVVQDLHGDLSGVSALLIGAGDMGEMVAEDMIGEGLTNLTVIHPRARRAQRTARVLDCNFAAFETLSDLVPGTDVIIAALGGGGRIVGKDLIAAALKVRRRRPILVVDTAVPGDVDPAVHDLDDAYVYDFGDLERIAMAGLAGRGAEAQAARRIVDEEVQAFLNGQRARDAGPLVADLRRHFEAQRAQALAEAGGDAEKATHILVGRLLHGPSTRLRRAAAEANLDLAAAERLIAHLFQPDVPDADDGRAGGGEESK